MTTQLTAGFIRNLIKCMDVASNASIVLHQQHWEAGELIRAEFNLDQSMKITDKQYGICAGKIARGYTTQLAAYAADNPEFDIASVDVVKSVRSFLLLAVKCRKAYTEKGLVGVFGGAAMVLTTPKATVLPTPESFESRIRKALTPAQIATLIALLSVPAKK